LPLYMGIPYRRGSPEIFLLDEDITIPAKPAGEPAYAGILVDIKGVGALYGFHVRHAYSDLFPVFALIDDQIFDTNIAVRWMNPNAVYYTMGDQAGGFTPFGYIVPKYDTAAVIFSIGYYAPEPIIFHKRLIVGVANDATTSRTLPAWRSIVYYKVYSLISRTFKYTKQLIMGIKCIDW